MEVVKGSQLDRCGYPLSVLPREPPGVRAPLQLHHRRLGQHSPVHSNAVVGDPWRPDSHLPTHAPPPPLPLLEGPVRWCALRAPKTTRAAAPHPGTFPGRSQSREALSAPRDPSTCHQRPRPWECGTRLVQQRHLCLQAVKERGPPQSCPAHTRPRAYAVVGRAACLCDPERDTLPWPTTPWWAQRQVPMASPPDLEHQATLAPHAQGPVPPPSPRTPARTRVGQARHVRVTRHALWAAKAPCPSHPAPCSPAHTPARARARLHTGRRYLPPTCASVGSGGRRQCTRPHSQVVQPRGGAGKEAHTRGPTPA